MRRASSIPGELIPSASVWHAPGIIRDAAGQIDPDIRTRPGHASSTDRIEIRCKGGRVLKVEADLDPAVLRTLIRPDRRVTLVTPAMPPQADMCWRPIPPR